MCLSADMHAGRAQATEGTCGLRRLCASPSRLGWHSFSEPPERDECPATLMDGSVL